MSTEIVIPHALELKPLGQWGNEDVVMLLLENNHNINLDDDDMGAIKSGKINGFALLGLTIGDLWALPLPVGPARNVFQLIQALKEKKGLLYASK